MKGDVILSLEPKTWALSPLDQFPYLYNLKRHLLLVAYFLRRTLVPCNFAPARHLDAPDPGAEAAPTPETQVPVACSASEAARLELPVLDTHLTTTLPLLAKLPLFLLLHHLPSAFPPTLGCMCTRQ